MFFQQRNRIHRSTCDTKKKATSSLACDSEKDTNTKLRENKRQNRESNGLIPKWKDMNRMSIRSLF